MSLTEEQLKGLAEQLSNPNGEHGISVANMMHESNIGMTMSTVNALKITANDNILELGHGNGKHIADILQKATNVTYTGLEISELMKYEAESQNLANAQFYLYDGSKIPFNTNTFTKVMTVNTIYFWKNPDAFIKEIYRVLKSGGYFAIGFADKNFMESLPFTAFGFNLYSKERIYALAEIAGFNVIDIGSYTEKIRSKAGDEVERPYYVAIAQK